MIKPVSMYPAGFTGVQIGRDKQGKAASYKAINSMPKGTRGLVRRELEALCHSLDMQTEKGVDMALELGREKPAPHQAGHLKIYLYSLNPENGPEPALSTDCSVKKGTQLCEQTAQIKKSFDEARRFGYNKISIENSIHDIKQRASFETANMMPDFENIKIGRDGDKKTLMADEIISMPDSVRDTVIDEVNRLAKILDANIKDGQKYALETDYAAKGGFGAEEGTLCVSLIDLDKVRNNERACVFAIADEIGAPAGRDTDKANSQVEDLFNEAKRLSIRHITGKERRRHLYY